MVKSGVYLQKLSQN